MTEDKPREKDILIRFNFRQAEEIERLKKEIADLKAENILLRNELAQIKSIMQVFNTVPRGKS